MDILDVIIEAVKRRAEISSINFGFQFRLISNQTLDESSIPEVKQIINIIEVKYSVKLAITSGSYGCTTLQVNIVAQSNEEALRLYNGILNDQNTQQIIARTFNILVIDKPYVRIDLIRGTVESNFYTGEINMSSKIQITDSQISGENINIGNGTIYSGTNEGKAINDAIKEIEKTIYECNEVSKQEAIKVISCLNDIKNEIASPKPDKDRISDFFKYLGGISSISTIANAVLKHLS